MLELATPHLRYHRSFLAAADEFRAEGDDHRGSPMSFPADDTFPGATFTRAMVESPEVFEEYVDLLVSQRREEAPRPRDFVPFTERWMVVDGEYVGRISLRHRLTEPLLTWGGHIGYAVRPAARGRGYASRALAMMLPTCAELGIDPVLVTCDTDNAASQRVIERNGGVYEDTRQGKLRFWVPVTASLTA